MGGTKDYNMGEERMDLMDRAAWLRTARGVAAAILLLPLSLLGADGALEHFERKIRPLLEDKCYACHSADAPSIFANLRLDSRAGLLRGGDSGPAVVPGDSASSLLLRAVRGEAKVPMPPTGRLSDEQIADLASWVDGGSPWPDEQGPGLPDPSEAFDLQRRRDEHWAWQPLRAGPPPSVANEDWPRSPVDRFILSELEKQGLAPARRANRHTLLRRVSFALTGLPPTPKDVGSFLEDDSSRAFENAVDRLMASPHFGERLARHWMDLVRYTESHGSEGDPDVPEAWRYRDYLIRAFNSDVPYDQLLREHLAGDLLTEPRYNELAGLNESLLATSHYRMIEHGFQPVDPWEDRVKWTDNQIDVFSKAFQGLTVSCARCHDHKFDAISQRDYYALFGIFASARPVQRAVDTSNLLRKHEDELRGMKQRVRQEVASVWLEAVAALRSQLREGRGTFGPALEEAACEPDSPLFPWVELSGRSGPEIEAGWRRLAEDWARQRAARERFNQERFQAIWRPGLDQSGWLRLGTGLRTTSSQAGEFSVVPEGHRIIEGIYAPGVYTGLLSRRHNGVLQSPRFTIDTDYISFLVQGGGFSAVRLIVENYAVPRGGIYDQLYSPKKDDPIWRSWDTTYWKGFSAYLEFATMRDATNFRLDAEDSRKDPKPEPRKDGRSYFGALAVAFHDDKATPKEQAAALGYLLEGPAPENVEELAQRYADRLREAVHAWRDGATTARQASYLNSFVRLGLLPSTLGASDRLDGLVAAYRELEEKVPTFRRAPSVLDEAGPDQPLLVRGDHKNLGERVPRRYLEALGGESYSDPATTRLRLAEQVTDQRNPLTARVMVNRIWGHLFGRGLVATVDNFGRVGDTPSHPELLDYLADQFMREGWSIKGLIRRLVLTATYQLRSEPSARAAELDPDSRLLQHMPMRRLEGEAIRDSLFAVSGRLDRKVSGPSVNVHYAFAKGKSLGGPEKGPLDGQGRRSVYQEIRRNAHNPFLEVFDQPKSSATRGRRDTTNVPAQSLTMLNSPLVLSQVKFWGQQLAARSDAPSDTVRTMFLGALGRPPTPLELDRSLGYLGTKADADAWSDLAHAIFNLKEFLYVR